MGWTVSETGVSNTRKLRTGEVFTFAADEIRSERTGIHARVSITLDKTVLAYDLFNVDRHKERVSLANAASGRVNGSVAQNYYAELYGAEEERDKHKPDPIRLDLDAFCGLIWAKWCGRFEAELLGGDLDTPPPPFMLSPYILEESGTILFAPGGSGKSYVALLMAVSVDAGCSDLWAVRQQPVLFVNLERSKRSVLRRLGLVNAALAQDATRRLRFINARGHTLSSIMDQISAIVAAEHIGLVVIDSISRGGYGDLNDNKAANLAMDELNARCPTWLAIAHQSWESQDPKSGKVPHPLGAVAFQDASDITVQIRSEVTENKTLGVGLVMRKANDIAKADLQVWALEFDYNGLVLVRPAEDKEFTAVEAGRPQTVADRIEELLGEIHGMSRGDIAAEITKRGYTILENTVGTHLNTMKGQGKVVLYSDLWFLPSRE